MNTFGVTSKSAMWYVAMDFSIEIVAFSCFFFLGAKRRPCYPSRREEHRFQSNIPASKPNSIREWWQWIPDTPKYRRRRRRRTTDGWVYWVERTWSCIMSVWYTKPWRLSKYFIWQLWYPLTSKTKFAFMGPMLIIGRHPLFHHFQRAVLGLGQIHSTLRRTWIRYVLWFRSCKPLWRFVLV